MIVIGCGPTVGDCADAVAIARQHPGVFATVGLHPHEAKHWSDDYRAAIAELGRDPRVVAVGEMGLDYHYDHSPRDVQRAVFEQQIELAVELGKPIVIHNRESDDDCMSILRQGRARLSGGVVHCFTSSWDLARVALDEGFCLGFTGIVSFRTGENVREVLKRTPLDRILIETDSPYLAPVPFRGRQNQPGYVRHVAEAVAATLGLSVEEVAELTTRNAERLFRLEAN